MNTVGHICDHVAHQLNDKAVGRSFTRWGRADVLEYLNQGMAEIGAYRPEALVSKVTAALAAGRVQNFLEYSAVLSIEGATEADATLSIAFATYGKCEALPEYDEAGNPKYTIRSYAIDKRNPKIIYVEPEVPSGLTPEVTMTVVTKFVPYTLADWNKVIALESKFYNNLIDFMLGRAYELDSESAQSRSNGQMHMRQFYTAMGVKYKMESAYKAGFYLGETGEGDPRARV